MLQRPLCLASLVPPALLCSLVAAPGCGAARPDPVTMGRSLEASFPGRSAAVLGAGAGFVRTAAGFSAGASPVTMGETPKPPAGLPSRRRGRPAFDLPADGADPIVFRGSAASISVREIGAGGEARAVDQAVAYARPGGASFWTALPDGAEEWLRFEAGAVPDGAPAATWEVAGANLVQRGDAVEVKGGAGRLWVTAPAAFAEGGQRVAARLRARGATIELLVDAGGRGVLVDPKWTAVAPMPGPFEYHAAVALNDGRAMVIGGDDGTTYAFPAAATYDPVANAWKQEPAMASARTNHTATTLTSGKVVAAGGQADFVTFDPDVEIFDPATETWTSVQMPHDHAYHTATLLEDGTLLLAGGWGPGICGGQMTTNNVDLYDPTLGVNGGWGPSTQMNDSRQSHAATLLPDGKVLVSGGSNGGTLGDSEIYDPVAQTWTLTSAALVDAREQHTAALLPDGTVLVAGGGFNGEGFAPIASAEIFDPVAGTWTLTGPLSAPRYLHQMAVLADGRVMVAGGEDDTFTTVATTEIYDPVAMTWSAGPKMTSPREDFSLTRLGNTLLAAGGWDGGGVTATAEVINFGLPDGAPCTAASACASQHCTAGLCCDSDCTGTCTACTAKLKGGGMDGTCGPIAAGTNPLSQCTDEGAASCGTDGFCDGKGACATYTDGTVCLNPTPCIVAVCAAGKCLGPHKLDGSPCPDGVCVAGACVPDPGLGSSSASSGGATSGSSASSGAGGASTTTPSGSAGTGGQGGQAAEGARLTGSGCAVGPRRPFGAEAMAMALGLLASLRRRRRRR